MGLIIAIHREKSAEQQQAPYAAMCKELFLIDTTYLT